MADHTKTISNRINSFGGAPSNKCGAISWGTDNWGYGANAVAKDVECLRTNAFSITDIINKSFTITTFNQFAVSSDVPTIYVIDSAGFYKLFIPSTTNGSDQVFTEYTRETSVNPGYSITVQTSTTWS